MTLKSIEYPSTDLEKTYNVLQTTFSRYNVLKKQRMFFIWLWNENVKGSFKLPSKKVE